MKATKKLLLIVLIVLTPVLFSCESKKGKAIDIEAEKAEIQKVIDEHLEAVDLMDVNRLSATCTDDLMEMPPNMPRIIGKDAYEEYCNTWKDFFKDPKNNDWSFEADEFVVSSDWAFQIGTYSTKFILQDDSILEDEGNYVWIFKKDYEDNWKWARVISNSTKPLPVSD
jgi:ketosteroid isomerase-like protein